MILRQFIDRARRHDWFAVFIDFAIVVFGIFIGLQASEWVQTRQNRATERSYLERLLNDSNENVQLLRQAIQLNATRADIFSRLSGGLDRGGPVPSQADLSSVMCRWFVQPAVNVRRGTYNELVSSGRLGLLRDNVLRDDLAREQAAHDEAARLDILTPAVQNAAAPLDLYRQWRIMIGAARKVDCRFDISGMRADPRVLSVLAQLYRNETSNKLFRQRELAAVQQTRERLQQLLS